MRRTVADFTFAIQLLESLIDEDSLQQKVLVVCSTKEAFLRQLTPTILAPQPQEIPASRDSLEEDYPPQEPLPHPFLTNTLGFVASVRALKVAFCPSVKSLRAYLSTHTTSNVSNLQHDIGDNLPSLIILDLVLLHRGTSELSVQGLSRTFACAVEAAARNGMNLRLVECKDYHDVGNPDRGYRLWDAQVPLLSGSVRLGGEGVNWAGRSISVKSIATRWLNFEETKTESAGVVPQAEDKEMLV